MNDLDHILLEMEVPEPSSDFTARVMATVRAESRAAKAPSWMLILAGVFVVLVAVPLLILTVEGFQAIPGDALSSRLLWFVALLVVTSVAAVLPMQLMDT